LIPTLPPFITLISEFVFFVSPGSFGRKRLSFLCFIPLGLLFALITILFCGKRVGLLGCLHLDVSQPLPSTLSIPTPNGPLLIPITYEGLHDVCALCGTPDHLLDHCPSLPLAPKLEVVVEKFRNQAINDPSPSSPSSEHFDMGGNWIRISPKKMGRSFGPSQLK